MLNRRTVFLVLLALFTACSDGSRTSHQSPIAGVDFEVEIKSVEWKSQHNSTFAYVNLWVGNETQSTVAVDIAKIVARLDGLRSIHTYFDSLGSVESRVEPVAVGGVEFSLYFVFPGQVKLEPGVDLEIVAFGLVNH